MTEFHSCNIAHHINLILAVDDLLRFVDPIGIGADSPDPHEYSPEIAGLVDMVVGDCISKEALRAVFEEMFGEGMVPNELNTQTILRGLLDLRENWLRWQSPEGMVQQ